MLKELLIKNFAIIEAIELSFGPGLSCLTGETGAGKSILVDAITAVLGGRVSTELLMPGKDATVEALFDITDMPDIASGLLTMGLDNSGELILRRVISSSGRAKAYINGSLVNQSALQEIGESLVDIHGQHEHQSLLKVDTQLDLLDAYLGLTDDAAEYRQAYLELAGLKKNYGDLAGREREREQRLDLLRFQAGEIDGAGLNMSEEDGLLSERAMLLHADRLRALAGTVIDALADSDAAALPALGGALKAARDILSIVPDQEDSLRLIESAEVSAREACSYMRGFADSLAADPDRLSAVEDRLDLLARLKKKYGETVADVILYREKVAAELAVIEHGEEMMEGLLAAISASEEKLDGLGVSLGGKRRSGADGLCARVEEELSGLGMDKSRFEVRFADLDTPGPKGMERAEFLISANQGQDPRPLVKVASGGELSRVMLALKVILAGADRVPTLIFDEVDAGIGGVTAGAVGRKLREVSEGRQVLCITHLPQIASLASGHYRVEKRMEGGKTAASVCRLGREDRVGEVARMLGGGPGSAAASAHAEELVRQGELYGQACA